MGRRGTCHERRDFKEGAAGISLGEERLHLTTKVGVRATGGRQEGRAVGFGPGTRLLEQLFNPSPTGGSHRGGRVRTARGSYTGYGAAPVPIRSSRRDLPGHRSGRTAAATGHHGRHPQSRSRARCAVDEPPSLLQAIADEPGHRPKTQAKQTAGHPCRFMVVALAKAESKQQRTAEGADPQAVHDAISKSVGRLDTTHIVESKGRHATECLDRKLTAVKRHGFPARFTPITHRHPRHLPWDNACRQGQDREVRVPQRVGRPHRHDRTKTEAKRKTARGEIGTQARAQVDVASHPPGTVETSRCRQDMVGLEVLGRDESIADTLGPEASQLRRRDDSADGGRNVAGTCSVDDSSVVERKRVMSASPVRQVVEDRLTRTRSDSARCSRGCAYRRGW